MAERSEVRRIFLTPEQKSFLLGHQTLSAGSVHILRSAFYARFGVHQPGPALRQLQIDLKAKHKKGERGKVDSHAAGHH